MDRNDPNTWTQSYVLSNKAECLQFLKETDLLVVKYIREGKYAAAVTGLDRILNGLVMMNNARCGDFRAHMSVLSLCNGSIIAFGNFDVNTPENRRKETALRMLQDARDFSKSEDTKKYISELIAALTSGMSLKHIKSSYDPDFPKTEIDLLTDLSRRFSDVSSSSSTTFSSSSSSGSSGGCYIATAVYGSYDCPQVWTLRRYRDNTLVKSWYGRLFIHTYYAISPTLVKWFGHAAWFKRLWKGKLDRMVRRLNAEGVKNTPYEDKI